jgi:hypothetical protein
MQHQTYRPSVVLATALLCVTTGSLAQTAPRAEDLRPLHGGWSAADIIGAPIRSADGDKVGEIEDLILSADAEVITALISVGGLLDVGDKLVGVPYDDLRVWPDDETLAIPLTNAEVEAAPTYQGHPRAAGTAEPLVDPARAAPPSAAVRREAEAEAERAFSGEDPRVAEGIAENKKAYEDEEATSQP